MNTIIRSSERLAYLALFALVKCFVFLNEVVPYSFVRRGVPVREDTCPEPSACEVGWPVPFLAAFIPPSVPTGYPFAAG